MSRGSLTLLNEVRIDLLVPDVRRSMLTKSNMSMILNILSETVVIGGANPSPSRRPSFNLIYECYYHIFCRFKPP